MQRPVFAANWKMNHGPSDARAFMRSFLAHFARRTDRQVIFFPPAVTLTTVLEMIKERQDILVGVQNIHWEDKGAFTGELSAGMARDAGATVALVGHSERRNIFGETDEQTGLKVAAAVRAGLTPMLCVGETLEEREQGRTEQVVLRQLRAGIANIDPHHVATTLVAYEPVWAIGTGRTATPDDAGVIHVLIRQELVGLLGERGNAIPICYGGSANRGNASALLAAPEVDGLLVGGASLDAEGWSSIVRT
ncbi:MAG TPA: triose-phosphate isomerase [Gemmatimonadaceae bacterium]|jgi:triosephosphate isomerase|nr:triose-phosphate isomerase [Gemmatimonadota bacterium]HPV77278.1 triose-phosphate isomerase [Gemmatimonadaceae bacterium]